MSSHRNRLVAVVVLLAFAGPPLEAQVQQQGAAMGKLVIADPRATAVVEYEKALDAFQSWSTAEGFSHAQRALALDSSFGLARALVSRYRAGPMAAAERNRAAVDAARGSAAEAVIALAFRAVGTPAAAALWNTAVELVPNDPRVSLDRALSLEGKARVDALREAAKKFPDHAATRQWLAFYLTPVLYPRPSEADGNEALAAAEEAVRLAPNASGSHTAMGHVLEVLGREDEALRHLQAATSMTPTNEFAFTFRAEILEHQGKPAEARAAIDSAIILTDNLGSLGTYRTQRALTFLHEGNVAATIAAMDENARLLEAKDQLPAAASARLFLAIVHAGSNNARAANEQIAIANRLGVAPGTLADNSIIVYSLTRQAVPARKALDTYLRLAQQFPPSELREQNIHRMTGLTLLAEGKAAEAIAELKQGGPNPYSQLGLIEAYVQLGDKKQADAERASLLARKDFGIISTAMPIAKLRSGMAKK